MGLGYEIDKQEIDLVYESDKYESYDSQESYDSYELDGFDSLKISITLHGLIQIAEPHNLQIRRHLQHLVQQHL